MHDSKYARLPPSFQPDDTHLAAGLADSTLSIRQRAPSKTAVTSGPKDSTPLNPSTYTSFLSAGADLGAIISSAETGRAKDKGKQKSLGENGEVKIQDGKNKRKKLRAYDQFLKEFRYGAALDAALRRDIPPTTSFSLVTELIHRDGLRLALSGRDDVSLEPILRFLIRNIIDTRFGRVASQVALVVIGEFEQAGQSVPESEADATLQTSTQPSSASRP